MILGNHARSSASGGGVAVTDSTVLQLEREHVTAMQAIMDMDDQNLSSATGGPGALILLDRPSSATAGGQRPSGRGPPGRQATRDSLVPGFEKAVKTVKDPVTAGIHARKATLKEFNLLCEKLALASAYGREVESYFKSDFDDEDCVFAHVCLS